VQIRNKILSRISAPKYVQSSASCCRAALGVRFIYREHGITASHFAIMRKMFQDADADGNGFLDKDEVRQVLMKHAGTSELDESRVENYFARADTNKDGRIDHAEFMNLVEAEASLEKVLDSDAHAVYRNQRIPAKQFVAIRESFLQADFDGNGFLDKAEVRELLEQSAATEGGQALWKIFTESEVEGYFRRADKNQDGKINLEEFLNAIVQKSEGS